MGGKSYGVAKRVSLVGVRVLGCAGDGFTSDAIAGIDWVTRDHRAGEPAVANVSFAGDASRALDSAVRAAVADGITMVIAAGNMGADACDFSPSRVDEALVVGATTEGDRRAPWSNRGACLDVFAPGSDIIGAGHVGDHAAATISGTSMASPFVAGAAALVLQSARAAVPSAVASAITSMATRNRIGAAGMGSPNRLLYTGAFDGRVDHPPVASISRPAAGARVSGTARITADGRDDEAVTAMDFFVDGHRVALDRTAPYAASWDTTALEDGEHTLTVVASDAAGQPVTSGAVEVVVDNGPLPPAPVGRV